MRQKDDILRARRRGVPERLHKSDSQERRRHVQGIFRKRCGKSCWRDWRDRDHDQITLFSSALPFQISDPNITERIHAPEENSLCPFRQEVVFPRAAKNKEDKWLFVVNQDQYVQGVTVEVCLWVSPAGRSVGRVSEEPPRQKKFNNSFLSFQKSGESVHSHRKLSAQLHSLLQTEIHREETRRHRRRWKTALWLFSAAFLLFLRPQTRDFGENGNVAHQSGREKKTRDEFAQLTSEFSEFYFRCKKKKLFNGALATTLLSLLMQVTQKNVINSKVRVHSELFHGIYRVYEFI